MQEIRIELGDGAAFNECRDEARRLALQENPEAEIISWKNRENNSQSPCCLNCEFDGVEAWEVYGANHGGRLKIVVNNGLYVFIAS